MTYGTYDELPLIALKNSKRSSLDGGKDAVTLGLSGMIGASARAADLSPLLAEELLHHLHRKLHEVASVRARAKWFGGRLYNCALNADVDYIALSAVHLKQVLALLDVAPPQSLPHQVHYLLRADAARWAHDTLGKRLDVAPDVLAKGLD